MKRESEGTRGRPLNQAAKRPVRKPLRWVGSSLDDLSQFPGEVKAEEKESMSGKIPIHDSSGNVFAELGIENADEYLAKSELAAQILRIVERRRLTQAAAGELLGITQPKVSALLNGRLDGFSTERLFRFLTKLGCDIQITVSKPHTRKPGHIEVLTL